MAIPPAPVRGPSQCPLAPNVKQLVDDKGDNEGKPGAVHRKTPKRIPSDDAINDCFEQGSLLPNGIIKITQPIREGERGGRKESLDQTRSKKFAEGRVGTFEHADNITLSVIHSYILSASLKY